MHKSFPLNDASCAIKATLCEAMQKSFDKFVNDHDCSKGEKGFDWSNDGATPFNKWYWKIQATGLGSSVRIVCHCGEVFDIDENCDHW